MSKKLSTTQVARLLHVAVASVAKWIDDGQLVAGRTPGGHRRVEATDLVEFLRRQGLRVPAELLSTFPKILIVDDEPTVTKWLAEEIREAFPEAEVLEANDGYAAGELVGTERPDVVVLDLRMPGMDGFEVCRRIKASETAKNTAVVAITAEPSPEAERRIRECGARSLLVKPLDTDLFIREVSAAIESRRR